MTVRTRWPVACLAGVAVYLTAIVVTRAQSSEAARPGDPVARLGRQLELGEVHLEFRHDGFGYLSSLLQQLRVNTDSQVLVFSKTSFQPSKISPQTPRAVYFNDEVAVGSVQAGEVFELMAVDPRQGLRFYSLSTHESATPRIEARGVECLFCHSPGNQGVPGFVVASVIPNAEGTPFFSGSFFGTIDHRTPLDQRWGGWYVTGTHGAQKHLGNAVAPDPDRPLDLDQAGTQNLTALPAKVDRTRYLEPTSDIVSLMTLEHQTGATNLIARIMALSRQTGYSAERVRTSRLDSAIDELVAYMLFADEAPLTDPVKGVSSFSRTFPSQGPRDSRGRSLRDFDLQARLFRYPMSYMVYSSLFDALPPSILERIWQRWFDALTDKDARGLLANRSAEDRRAVLEILRETKPNLPAYWRAPSSE
jgi:hypothetical protein